MRSSAENYGYLRISWTELNLINDPVPASRWYHCALREHSQAMVLWHGFELPTHPALGIYDSQIAHGQSAVVHILNDKLRQSLGKAGNAYFVDLNLCIARVP